MATNQPACSLAEEDEYIHMEVSSSLSSSNFHCHSISSPPQSREFEFQMSSLSNDTKTTASPADELFYKGKLLPLLLPPRLQMVQTLLQNPTTSTFDCKSKEPFLETYPLSLITSSRTPLTNSNATLDSCNISPSESCRVSSELSPDDYCFEWSSETNSFIGDLPKKSWTKKLKHSSLRQKLKASTAYLKSLFSKSDYTDESFVKPAQNGETESYPKSKDRLSKKPFCRTDNQIYQKCNTLKKSTAKDMVEDGFFNNQRRSFSGVIQWHTTTKFSSSSSTSSSGSSSTSSSFSCSSNGTQDLCLLKRSSSANSEIESSIEGAIAHCRKSQEMSNPRKSASESSEFAVTEIACLIPS
ncbi:hypothetical protein K2173_019378 [Erythroxylum novogranatense]|uniref:Membrane-associated kinase regulator 4 n=1 Tax=Erythroxylum novogranatense TaxID=1862640 RepID=A0AAV8UAU2_9ROSI|nr:hypothetical protein K2173_019378 [Erythroxylum novogranatense]